MADYYHLEDSDHEYIFTCNQCNKICRDCRLYCKACEVGSANGWNYESFDLCVHCFQYEFHLQNHKHPRESFRVERVRKCSLDIEDEIIPIPSARLCEVQTCPQPVEDGGFEMEGNSTIQSKNEPTENIQFGRLKNCVFCKIPQSSSNPFAACIFTVGKIQFRAHFGCARYSPEVYYFPRSKKWFNVGTAYKRSRNLKCAACKKIGATLGCWHRNCYRSYHIPCSGYSQEAFKSGTVFWCSLHAEGARKFKTTLKCNICKRGFSDISGKLFKCSICHNDFHSSSICIECLKGNDACNSYCHVSNFSGGTFEKNALNRSSSNSLCHSIENFIPLQSKSGIENYLSISKPSKGKTFRCGPSEEDFYSLDITSSYFDIPGTVPRWATHSGLDFPGTWIPQLVRWAILSYTQRRDFVVSNFLGRGTDAIEAFLLGRNFCGFDINPESVLSAIRNIEIIEENLGSQHPNEDGKKVENPQCTTAKYQVNSSNNELSIGNLLVDKSACQSSNVSGRIFEILLGDARSLHCYIPNDETIKLVLSHPPYFNCISYSNGIEGDLSNCKTLDNFLTEIRTVSLETNRILLQDGICFLMMGDNREAKVIKPLALHTLDVYLQAGFCCEQIVIKRQRGCSGTTNGACLASKFDFLYLMHEFIFILQKSSTKNERQLKVIEKLSRFLNCDESQLQNAPRETKFKSVEGQAQYQCRTKRPSGTIWTFSSKCKLYHDITDRFAKVGTSYIIFSEDFQQTEAVVQEPLFESECQYEQQRLDAVKRNIQLFFDLSPITPSEIHPVVSLVLIDLTGLQCEAMLDKLSCCLSHVIGKIPVMGNVLIGCKDYRTSNDILVPSSLIVWKWMKDKFENSSRMLILRDLLICVPKGLEKVPGSKQYSLRTERLPIVHQYFLIYQLKVQ